MHLPLRFAASLAQRGKELLAVVVIPEDILALVPSIHDMIHGPGILNAQLARHGQPLPAHAKSVNSDTRIAGASDKPEFEAIRPKTSPVATYCKSSTCRSVTWKDL